MASKKRARRVEAHGDSHLVSLDMDALTEDERDALPPALAEAFAWWTDAHASRFDTLPETLAWARDALRGRRVAIERLCFNGDRIYWALRLVPHGDLAAFFELPVAGSIGRSCIGGTGLCLPDDDALGKMPPALAWLAKAFGTANLTSETSGTAPWGWSLGDAVDQRFGLFGIDDDIVSQLPSGHRDWKLVYEIDGDAVAIDPEGQAHWLGWEWTGQLVTPLGLDATAVTHFVFWRLLEGGCVRPSDLAMLRAATTR